MHVKMWSGIWRPFCLVHTSVENVQMQCNDNRCLISLPQWPLGDADIVSNSYLQTSVDISSIYGEIPLNSWRQSGAYMRQWTNHHGFRKWLGAIQAPSHYLNQCWNIADSNFRNKLQWNHQRHSYIFIQDNAFEMSSGKWRSFCLGINVLLMQDVLECRWFKPTVINANYLYDVICLFIYVLSHVVNVNMCLYIYRKMDYFDQQFRD